MTPDRFEALAQAYGGDLRRWPEAERTAAAGFALAHPVDAEKMLGHAAALDAALDRYKVPAPAADLASRILAARPRPADWRRWGAGLGAGLAAACAAGVLFGIQVSEQAARDARTEAVIAAGLDGDATTGSELIQIEEQG